MNCGQDQCEADKHKTFSDFPEAGCPQLLQPQGSDLGSQGCVLLTFLLGQVLYYHFCDAHVTP